MSTVINLNHLVSTNISRVLRPNTNLVLGKFHFRTAKRTDRKLGNMEVSKYLKMK